MLVVVVLRGRDQSPRLYVVEEEVGEGHRCEGFAPALR